MLPKTHHRGFNLTLITLDIQHPFPDTRQVSQIKNVMKFGWSWQHLYLQAK